MGIRWRISLLGAFRVEGDGRTITHFTRQKAAALLAYLAYHGHRPEVASAGVRRDLLVELLWPESDPDQGRNSLSVALSWLRRQLEPAPVAPGSVLVADRASVRLNPTAFTTDLQEFDAALGAAEVAERDAERAEWLRRALDQYCGELLPGFYEDWVFHPREWLAERFFQSLSQLLAYLQETGEWEAAHAYARRGVELDPLREEAHADLIRILAASGQVASARRHYAELERILEQQLDASPSPASRDLLASLGQESLPDSPRASPATGSVRRLPPQPTRFIGRERERVEIRRLLAESPLLTLTGVGGCGKTRLALQVAADLGARFPDGVWVVELASVADAALVPQAAAAVLGLREQSGESIEASVADQLRSRSLLLILDNCEHLLAGCRPLVCALLESAPRCRILATSREPLHVPKERVWRVPTLALPDPGTTLPPERLLQYDAVRLFVERAAESRPGFVISAANAGPVEQICRRLDGLSLAIELAAARLGVLTVEQLANRLRRPFQILTRGSEAALPRHRTLRATLDWSYDLLSEAERALLIQLSVFDGSFSLEAAEAVCGDDLLDRLTSLIEKSLVVLTEPDALPPGLPGGASLEAQYRLLQTVREYAREHVDARGEWEAARQRHAEYFLAFVEEAQRGFRGPEEGRWLDRLESALDDLRAALRWGLGETEGGRARSPHAELAQRLAGGLWTFWWTRGYWTEGRRWLERVLALETGRTAARARALAALAGLAAAAGDLVPAAAAVEECAAIYEERGDSAGTAWALTQRGWLAHRRSDSAAARAFHEASLAIRRELGDLAGMASSLNNLGVIAVAEGEFATARVFHQQCLGIQRALGNSTGAGWALLSLAEVASAEGAGEESQSLFRESLGLFRESGHRRAIETCLRSLGVLILRGRSDEAGAGRAARLLGAARALHVGLGEPSLGAYNPDVEAAFTRARQILGDAECDRAVAEGERLPLIAAIDLALEELPPGPGATFSS
jgi:non-specific serine/threonine protein kinase